MRDRRRAKERMQPELIASVAQVFRAPIWDRSANEASRVAGGEAQTCPAPECLQRIKYD